MSRRFSRTERTVAAVAAALGVAMGGGIAHALWRSTATSETYARSSEMVFIVNDASELHNASGWLGDAGDPESLNLHANPPDKQTQTYSPASIISDLRLYDEAYIKLGIDAATRGKVNLSYRNLPITYPTDSLLENVSVTAWIIADRDAFCETEYSSAMPETTLDELDLTTQLFNAADFSGPDISNWYDASVTYCLRFTVDTTTTPTEYTNTATVTAETPGGNSLSDSATWAITFGGFDYAALQAELISYLTLEFTRTYSHP